MGRKPNSYGKKNRALGTVLYVAAVAVMLGCIVYFAYVARERERLYREQVEQMQEDITLSYQKEKRKEQETERRMPVETEEKRISQKLDPAASPHATEKTAVTETKKEPQEGFFPEEKTEESDRQQREEPSGERKGQETAREETVEAFDSEKIRERMETRPGIQALEIQSPSNVS